jgi:hypothetical protein
VSVWSGAGRGGERLSLSCLLDREAFRFTVQIRYGLQRGLRSGSTCEWIVPLTEFTVGCTSLQSAMGPGRVNRPVGTLGCNRPHRYPIVYLVLDRRPSSWVAVTYGCNSALTFLTGWQYMHVFCAVLSAIVSLYDRRLALHSMCLSCHSCNDTSKSLAKLGLPDADLTQARQRFSRASLVHFDARMRPTTGPKGGSCGMCSFCSTCGHALLALYVKFSNTMQCSGLA